MEYKGRGVLASNREHSTLRSSDICDSPPAAAQTLQRLEQSEPVTSSASPHSFSQNTEPSGCGLFRSRVGPNLLGR